MFHISEVKERDFKIDSLKWLKDESLDDGDELPEAEELAGDAIAEVEAVETDPLGVRPCFPATMYTFKW